MGTEIGRYRKTLSWIAAMIQKTATSSPRTEDPHHPAQPGHGRQYSARDLENAAWDASRRWAIVVPIASALENGHRRRHRIRDDPAGADDRRTGNGHLGQAATGAPTRRPLSNGGIIRRRAPPLINPPDAAAQTYWHEAAAAALRVPPADRQEGWSRTQLAAHAAQRHQFSGNRIAYDMAGSRMQHGVYRHRHQAAMVVCRSIA